MRLIANQIALVMHCSRTLLGKPMTGARKNYSEAAHRCCAALAGLLKLAVCVAAAAAAASAQTVPVYKIDRVAGLGERAGPGEIFESCDSTYLGTGGPATAVAMNPTDVALDSAGNLFIAIECSNLYRVDAVTGISTIVARYRSEGPHAPGGDGGPAMLAKLYSLQAIALDNSDNIFLIDGNSIRRIDAVTGIITTIAGSGIERGFNGDGGPAANARFHSPNDLAVDDAGNIFIADRENGRIRRIDAVAGIITTVAGGGENPADGGPATGAALDRFSQPLAIALDGAGNIFFPEKYRIRKVDATTGIISTVAEELLSPAVGGSLGINTRGLALDGDGNIFVANWLRVLRVDAATGAVTHIAGNGDYNSAGHTASTGDGGPAVDASIGAIFGMAADGAGNVFLAGNNAVRRLTPWAGNIPEPPRISAGGVVLASGTPIVNGISPNAIFSAFGSGFATPGASPVNLEFNASGRIADVLADTCLEIGDKRAPLFLLSPNQINAQAPHDLMPGRAAVRVIRGCGGSTDTLQRIGEETTARVAAVTPAFFNFVNNPDGSNPLAAHHGGGPALVGPPELGAAFTPAAPGETVTLYGTGFGPTDPAIQAGRISRGPTGLAYRVSFTVGGVAVAAQDVLYAGASPGFAGVYQFALRLPANLPDGDAPVTANVLGVFTPPGPFLTIQRQ